MNSFYTIINKSDSRRVGSLGEEDNADPGWGAELERVSSRLLVPHKNEDGWRYRLEQSMNDMHSVSVEFESLEPQITHVCKLVTDELRQVESKEVELNERYRDQIHEYKQAKAQLKHLDVAHGEHSENTKNLSEDLECISEELDQVKKKMDGKASSMTDATPLVEIRAAIQRLKKENKELDISIGVLDYELTQARMIEANPQEHSPNNNLDESDDEHSFGNE